jgi:hypothetical protein
VTGLAYGGGDGTAAAGQAGLSQEAAVLDRDHQDEDESCADDHTPHGLDIGI